MITVDDVISQHRQKMLELGYEPRLVEMAIQWAVRSARGISSHLDIVNSLDQQTAEKVYRQMLVRLLYDARSWMRAVG